MRFIEVEKIPESQKNKPKVERHRLIKELEEFMNMNVRYVRVIFGENEYTNPKSIDGNIYAAIRRGGFPIKMVTREKDRYLMRTDI